MCDLTHGGGGEGFGEPVGFEAQMSPIDRHDVYGKFAKGPAAPRGAFAVVVGEAQFAQTFFDYRITL